MDLKIKCVNTTTDSDGSIYGKFVLEPLERGYGTTLGNALRRVLLSSLEGAAVTSVRIEGITHEYTSIQGVVEDVTDVLLNLKGLVVKTEDDDTYNLRLDIDRSGPVLASDIQLPAGVKIINPDWLICNISEGGSLHADITVETGKGYLTTDMFQKNSQAIDVLPIDAVFMPIKKVSYTVENTRVGNVTDFDKLIIEVWSNGSVEVNAALSKAANLLIEHFLPIASLTGQTTVIGTAPVVEEEEVLETTSKTPSIGIEELDLSVRAYNCLKRASINSLEELLLKSEHDLLNIKNFGKKSSDEVIERLHAFGLKLKPNPENLDEE